MKEQDRFEDFVRTAINELDPAPLIPREQMWARIAEARRFRRKARRALPAWALWSAALAAMLVIGAALGRISALHQSDTQSNATRVARGANEGGESQSSALRGEIGGTPTLTPYRLAALQHLGRAEMLLTSVSSGAVDPQVHGWAKDMLTTTRLLLDSPAASDARMAHLLEDLELLLAQIANATVSVNDAELHLIQHGIEQTDVLTRLRATLPAHPAIGT